MQAIKIDVENKTIEFVDIQDGHENISKAIADHCNIISCPICYENENAMYCDDESLLKVDDIKGGFSFPRWGYPITGNAIILGTDEEGKSVDVKSSLDAFRAVKWWEPEEIKKFFSYML